MFYDKFKQLCEQKNVSCTKAAVEMGLSNATPTKWKKTGATPDSATLAKVSDYFGVSIGYLLDKEHPTTSGASSANKNAPTPEGGRELPHAAQREILAGKGIRIMLDADAKLTEAQLEDILNFIEFQQGKNGR